MHDLLRSAAGFLLALLSASSACAVAHAAAAAPDGLQPGEFVWTPEFAPRGPLAIVVSLPEQRAYVYRNGVRIGTSTVSTGKPGYETPSGIYTILQKHREHYSNLYDDAPMPFMQRLTWSGVALHAGALPGYPASHGCVRLPVDFAERLFAATVPGTVVVIADAGAFPPAVVSPGLFSPIDAVTGTVRPQAPGLAVGTGEWHPERAPDGPLTILLSTADRQLVVLRNATEVGRSSIVVNDAPAIGTRAYLLLDGTRPGASTVLPDRPALRWLALPPVPDAAGGSADTPREAFASGRIVVPQAFARAVYEALRPGATVILTDEPLQPGSAGVDVLISGASR